MIARNAVNAIFFRWGDLRGGREVRKDHFADGTDCPGLNFKLASVRKNYQHTGTEVRLDTGYVGETGALQAHLFNGYDTALSNLLS